MASLTEIRQALADALKANVDLDWQVSPFILGSSAVPPCAQVVPDETDYHQAMQDGAETWGFSVQALVALNSNEGAQLLLDQLLESDGTLSVKAALEKDVTLGGLVDDVTVVSTSGYREYPRGPNVVALGAEWTVNVLV